MRNITFIVFGLILTSQSISYSQKQDTVFYDRNWNICTKKIAGYYRLETKVKTNDTSYWKFSDHYIENNKIQNEGFLTKKNPETRHGHWIWYYSNGKLEMEGDYSKNDRIGIWKYFHTDGSLKKQGLYNKKGKQDGEWNWYYTNGALMSKVTYKNDSLVGKRVMYHENGKLRLQEYYLKNRLDSTQTEWFSTGTKKSEVNYLRGFKNGLEKTWYMDGKPQSEITYKSGLIESEKWFSDKGTEVPKDSVIHEKEFHNLLWKISGNGLQKPSYLFGTMHVKDKRAFEFSDSMLLAFKQSEGYSMEIHPDSLYAYYFKQYDKQKTWMNFGSEYIGNEDGDAYFEDWGSSYGAYSNWVMNLNQLFHRDEYNPEGMPYFIDCYLYYLATKNGKHTDGIERVVDHVNAGRDLPPNTMRYDILSKFDPEEEMLECYQEGHLDRINALMDFLQDKEFKYRLLTLRNVKMANSIDSLAKIRATFNTAGTAHLPGKDGLIELLKQKGYTLTPATAKFSGDTLDNQIFTPKNNWRKVRPYEADFTVNSPGNLISFSNGLVRNIFLDPIREIGLDAFQLDERWYMTGSKSNKVEDSDINYLFDSPEIIKRKNITHNGVNGLELNWKVSEEIEYRPLGYEGPKEDNTYYKARIFKENFQIYVVQVASKSLDSLNSEYCNTFLNSIEWDKEPNPTQNWKSMSDDMGAFTVEIPENAQKQIIHYNPSNSEGTENYDYYKKTEQKIHLWKSTDKGNQYIVRYNNAENGTWHLNDIEIQHDALDYYLEFLDKLKDSTYASFNNYPSLDAKIKINTSHYLMLKYINRGYRNYLMIAKIDKKKKSKKNAAKFFNSLKFNDLNTIYYQKYTTEADSIGILLPPNVQQENMTSDRNFIADRTEEWDYSNEMYDYQEASDYKTNWYNEPQEEEEQKEIEVFETRNKYFGQDSATGVNYQTYIERFSEYYFIPSADSLFNNYLIEFSNDEYVFTDTLQDSTKINGSTTHWRHYSFAMPHQNGKGELRFTQKGTTIVIQRVFYPQELDKNKHILDFFDSLNLSKVKDSLSIFTDKSSKILNQLSSKDSLEQVYAGKALLFYPFDQSDVSQIQTALATEVENRQKVTNILELVHLLRYINDSTTAAFINQLSPTIFTDSLELKLDFLQEFTKIDRKLAYTSYTNLVKQSLVKPKKNTYEYRKLARVFEDSLQLFADNHKNFNHWMNDTIWSLELKILKMTNAAFQKNKINTDSILANSKCIVDKFLWTANWYKNIKKDSSIYTQAQDNLIEYTKLISHLKLENDSLEKTMLRLFEDKNKELKFESSKYLFKSKNALSDKEKEKMFKDIKTRYKLFLVLNEIDAENQIPSNYKSKESVAQAQLYHALANPEHNENEDDYYGQTKPVNFKLIKIQKATLNKEKMLFYVYSYYDDGYSREKRVAVSNPMPAKKDSITYFAAPLAVSELYGRNTKIMVKSIVKQWNYEHDELITTIENEGLGEGEEVIYETTYDYIEESIKD